MNSVSAPPLRPWPRNESAWAGQPRAANHGRKYGSQHQLSQYPPWMNSSGGLRVARAGVRERTSSW
jgi:hypothetical protein